MTKIGFKNYGTKQSQAWKLTFNGHAFGDQRSFSELEAARDEAQRYFDGERGDINIRYSLDGANYCRAMSDAR